ncbi:MAG TPA: toprim domain-containing protein [Polyangiaceae bacterium]|jgi:DNA primase|nr:toprim domain-containing protein [Polyangiaceae bacterium]
MRSGLAGSDGRITHAEHRLLIPWRSPTGSITCVQRRVIDDRTTGRYVLPAERSPLWPYGVDRARDVATNDPGAGIAFVEGAADVLAFRELAVSGGHNIAVLGIPSATEWRAPWATFAAARRAFIAVDNDDAGNKRVPTMHHDLVVAGATFVGRIVPNGTKDWADQLQNEGQENQS